MKPYVISHMMMSVDGRIDCAMTELIEDSQVYYDALETLNCPSQMVGRTTAQMHYALPEPFEAEEDTPVGRANWYAAGDAHDFSIVVDTHGKLRYPTNRIDGRPILVMTSRSCPMAYLDYLVKEGISWIAEGEDTVDLTRALDVIREQFGVRRIALLGGGHLNGSMIEAGLVDEVSIMMSAAIDGRAGMAAVYDSICQNAKPFLLNLKDVTQVGRGTIWARYTVQK